MQIQRSSTSADKAIGQRIRLCRVANKISQTDLGEKIGVTFQQVQKYEKGINRVGATRLTDIAGHLGVTTNSLLGIEDGSEPVTSDVAEILAWLGKPASMKLVRSCMFLSTGQRGLLAEFIASVAI